MKSIIKIVVWIIGVLVVLVVIGGIIFLNILFPPPLSKEATEKDFLSNQDNIMLISDYLVNSKYSDIYINNSHDSGIMFAGLNGEVSIDNPQVIRAIDILFKKKGYSVISKDGNTISFQRSTRFRDFGSGVAYSMDGEEPQLQFLTLLAPLSIEDWYYYEEDDNEYKRRIEND